MSLCRTYVEGVDSLNPRLGYPLLNAEWKRHFATNSPYLPLVLGPLPLRGMPPNLPYGLAGWLSTATVDSNKYSKAADFAASFRLNNGFAFAASRGPRIPPDDGPASSQQQQTHHQASPSSSQQPIEPAS
jgi:hypothetical protein